MKDFMQKTREIFYREQGRLGFGFNKNNRLTIPDWMTEKKDIRFDATYRDQKKLMKKGRIVLGCIVQANSLLFKQGRYNSPAAMIYSEDPYFEEFPDQLKSIASGLYQIKGVQSEDEELQKFSDILEDEMVTLFHVEVPLQITFNKKVYFTSLMVHREHLPKGYIDFSFFPALIYAEKTEASIILPGIYWATETQKVKKERKILSDSELSELSTNDPEKYIDIIEDHIEYTWEKIRLMPQKADNLSARITCYSFQKSTALSQCGRFWEAKVVLFELLSQFDMDKAQERGGSLFFFILSNLVGTLTELGQYPQAREYLVRMEKTISNCRDEKAKVQMSKSLTLDQMELDILSGDLEQGGRTLKQLLDAQNSPGMLATLCFYSGVYHFKRNEREEALQFFNKALTLNQSGFFKKKTMEYIAQLA